MLHLFQPPGLIRCIFCRRRRVGVMSGDILDVIASWPADKQEKASAIIEEIEVEVWTTGAQKCRHQIGRSASPTPSCPREAEAREISRCRR